MDISLHGFFSWYLTWYLESQFFKSRLFTHTHNWCFRGVTTMGDDVFDEKTPQQPENVTAGKGVLYVYVLIYVLCLYFISTLLSWCLRTKPRPVTSPRKEITSKLQNYKIWMRRYYQTSGADDDRQCLITRYPKHDQEYKKLDLERVPYLICNDSFGSFWNYKIPSHAQLFLYFIFPKLDKCEHEANWLVKSSCSL